MSESLAQFFLMNFEAHRKERAYGQRRGYRTEWFTYGQVMEMAFQFRAKLETQGIGKGERVMLWGENCAEWVAAFFGCVFHGVIVVPMDDGASADFAARVAREVEAKLWVCSRRHARHTGEAGAVPYMVLEDSLQTAGRTSAPLSDSRVAVGRNDILQIVFTSGTTAEPKGVVITHGNVLANIVPLEQEMQRYLKYERLDISTAAAGRDGNFSGGV
jgi:long-chain acyl-CoA synthetase